MGVSRKLELAVPITLISMPLHPPHQLPSRHLQRLRQVEHAGERWVLRPTLQKADVRIIAPRSRSTSRITIFAGSTDR